jgi:hypothetical protein
MTTYSFPERDKLEELIDKWFPKGKCKERGAALMVNAEFVIWLGKRMKNPEYMDLQVKSAKK